MKKTLSLLLFIVKVLVTIVLLIFLIGFLNGISEREREYYIIMTILTVVFALIEKVTEGRVSVTLQILIGICIVGLIDEVVILKEGTYWTLFLSSIVFVLLLNKNRVFKKNED